MLPLVSHFIERSLQWSALYEHNNGPLLACMFVFGAIAPQWARASSFTRFLDHTQRRTTVGKTPLDE